MKTTKPTLSSIVATHLDEGGDLLATLFLDDRMNEATGMALVTWFGKFQREVERVGR